MKDTLVIVNPLAGRGAGVRAWGRVRAHFGLARAWDCVVTERPGHARELAGAAATDYSLVVAVGGDGTVCEVANGLRNTGTGLAIIPAGTGNDIARNLTIPRDPVAATQLALTGTPRPIDLGQVSTSSTTMSFVNIAGIGFDAEAAWRVNRLPKLGGGTLPYLAGVLLTLFQYRAPLVRLHLDGQAMETRVFLVAVGNCASYAGGMRIVPRAQPDDGIFDVCVVKDLHRLEVLRILPSLYSGAHVRHPAVEIVRCREVSVDAPERVLCQADGELVGALPARFALQPAALQCVTGPASYSHS